MVSWFKPRLQRPIGIDLGSRSLKMIQFNADYSAATDAARWDIPFAAPPALAERRDIIRNALKQLRTSRNFVGREAVLCLTAPHLHIQNIRVPKLSGEEFEKTIRQDAAARLPFPLDEAEVRFIEAGDVRQADAVKREVILLACQRTFIEEMIAVVQSAGLHVVGVDPEPAAVLRCYSRQFRRDDDKVQCHLYVHVGSANTSVTIARGEEVLFVKYLEVGGRHMDESVARHLEMDLQQASILRRSAGDRRNDQQDPDVAGTMTESLRPIVERLSTELSLCIRYHSVTFRGRPLTRAVLTGGEANGTLAELLTNQVGMEFDLGDPLRRFQGVNTTSRKGQWDVAVGLALRELV
jgi:type IV pilus assembly protein PilM